MKKLVVTTLGVMVFALVVAATPAKADVTAGNEGTGANSTNNATATVTTKETVNVELNAGVMNDVLTLSDSGANTANGNTGNGSVTSGDSSATTAVNNKVNSDNVTTAACGCVAMGDVKATNKNTGVNSKNNTTAKVTSTRTAGVISGASVGNGTSTQAYSGGNKANWNTGSGTVKSGKVTSSTDLKNKVNTGNTNTL